MNLPWERLTERIGAVSVPGYPQQGVFLPRWLATLAGFVLVLLSAGWAGATYFSVRDVRLTNLARADTVLSWRVDTVTGQVRALIATQAQQSEIIKGIGKLTCQRTPAAQLELAGMPCEQLLGRRR